MSNKMYNNVKMLIGTGGLNWDQDTIKVALVTSGYVPNIDTDKNFSDVTHEVAGQGYTADGNTLSNKTVTVDDAGDFAKYDADDVVWADSTLTARGAVLIIKPQELLLRSVVMPIGLRLDNSEVDVYNKERIKEYLNIIRIINNESNGY